MIAGWDASSIQSLPGILDEVSDDERRYHRDFLCRHIDMLVDILLAEQVSNGRSLPVGCPSATDMHQARQRRSNGQYPCSARRLSISPHFSVDDLPDCCSDPLREDGDPLDIVIATAIAPGRSSTAFRYFDHEWWNAVSDLRTRLGDWETIADMDSKQLEVQLANAGIDDRASTAADHISSVLESVADMERISGMDISDLVGLPYESIADFLASLPGITDSESWWLLLVAFDRPVWPADHRIDSQLWSLGLIDQGAVEISSGRRTEVEDLLSDREIAQLHRALSIHAVNAGVDHCENCEASKFYLTHRARQQQRDQVGSSVVDVFSGAGGLSAGFRDAGYQIEFAVDHDQNATDTFRLNHPELPHRQVMCSDITDFAPDELRERVNSNVDIVVGGPPCQALSVAGYRSRLSKDEDYSVLDDDRTALYTRYVDIIRELEPELLVMENVEGLISEVGDTGIKVADQVLEALEEEGYLCEYRLLDCTRFGIPQERERVIIIGGSTDLVSSREEVQCWFDRLVDTAPDETATLRHGLSGIPLIQRGEGDKVVVGGRPGRPSDYVSENNLTKGTSLCFNHRAREHPMEKDRLLFDEALEPGDTGWHIKYNTDYGHLVEYDVGTEDNPRFKDKYRMLEWDEPAPTVVAHLAKDSNSFVLPDYYQYVSESSISPASGRNRGITPREAARLQSFRDDYIFLGSFTSWFRQIGNAVPPVLAKYIGELCEELLARVDTEQRNSVGEPSREPQVGDD